MIKKTVFVLSLIFTVQYLSAQGNMAVSKFRPLEEVLEANISGTMVKDQNNETAALIKVVTPLTGFVFEGDMNGIVHTVQKTSEIWVYVPRGSKVLTIKHPQFGVLRHYEYPCSIEAGRTYELVLDAGEAEKGKRKSFLEVTVQPKTAILIICDGEKFDTLSLNADGKYWGLYPSGDYTYHTEHSECRSQDGVFTVIPEKTTSLNISLESLLATLSIECSTPGSEIYLDNEKIGTFRYYGKVKGGIHLLDVRRQGYHSYHDFITIGEQERRFIPVPALTPILGSLKVDFKPVNANINIDGSLKGRSPQTFNDITIGEHEVKIWMNGYQDFVKRVKITENHQTKLEGKLAVTAAVSTASVAEKTDTQESGRKKIDDDKWFSDHFLDFYMGCDVSGTEELFFGFSYTWIGNKIGPYMSGGIGQDGEFSAFGGAAWRITDPDYSSLDWHLNGGIGYFDHGFGGEIGTRFAWRTKARLSKLDFGVGCQFTNGRIVPTLSIGFYL